MIASSKQKNVEFTHQYFPVSVGLYQKITINLSAEKCLVEDDPSNLFDKFVDYKLDLSLKNNRNRHQKNLIYLQPIEEMIMDYDVESVGDSTRPG